MKAKIHPHAKAELYDSVVFYESQGKGVGADFYKEVFAAIDRIIEHPSAWPSIDGEFRLCRTRRYPYGIVYSIEKGYILVVAVMHNRRKPGYWKYRVQ